VDLLLAHEYGWGKYEHLGRDYRLKAGPIPPERQEDIKSLFEEAGLKTQIPGG
jgi:hypothetical protein